MELTVAVRLFRNKRSLARNNNSLPKLPLRLLKLIEGGSVKENDGIRRRSGNALLFDAPRYNARWLRTILLMHLELRSEIKGVSYSPSHLIR